MAVCWVPFGYKKKKKPQRWLLLLLHQRPPLQASRNTSGLSVHGKYPPCVGIKQPLPPSSERTHKKGGTNNAGWSEGFLTILTVFRRVCVVITLAVFPVSVPAAVVVVRPCAVQCLLGNGPPCLGLQQSSPQRACARLHAVKGSL